MGVADHLIEALSERVHRGWELEKQRQGFADHVFHVDVIDNPETATRCRKRIAAYDYCSIPRDKHHTDMLPYADLAEHIKEYDRATVRAVLGALDALGYQIVPQAAVERRRHDEGAAESTQEATTDTTTTAGNADDRRGAGHPASRPPRRGPSTLTTDNEEPS